MENSLHTKLPHIGHKTHQLTDGGTYERRGVADVVETFLLDEVSNSWGEVLVVGLNIVLQYQTAEGASRLVCGTDQKNGTEGYLKYEFHMF